MPRKIEVNKEMIIQGGIEVIKDKGYRQLSARNIAKHLGCSTQPIYYCFENIEMLGDAISRKVYEKMIKQYQQKDSGEDAFLQMGLGYIEFAMNESNLFEFLYFSRQNKGINSDEKNEMMGTIKQGEKMEDKDDETIRRIHEKISLFVHGLALTVMNRPEIYTQDEVRSLIVETAQDITKGEEGRKRK